MEKPAAEDSAKNEKSEEEPKKEEQAESQKMAEVDQDHTANGIGHSDEQAAVDDTTLEQAKDEASADVRSSVVKEGSGVKSHDDTKEARPTAPLDIASTIEALSTTEPVEEKKGTKRGRDDNDRQAEVEDGGTVPEGNKQPTESRPVSDGPFPKAEALLSSADGPRALLGEKDEPAQTTHCDDPRRLGTVERLVVSWEQEPVDASDRPGSEETDEGEMGETVVPIPAVDVPCFVGKGGSTRNKIMLASGVKSAMVREKDEDANDDPQQAAVVLKGTAHARELATKYIRIVLSRRGGGEVRVDLEKDNDGDLTAMRDVPRSSVALILGTKGAKLRRMEEQWKTMVFLLGNTEPLPGEDEISPDKVVLAIFGAPKGRKQCEMEVKNLVESKVHGFYTGCMKEVISDDKREASDVIKVDKSDAIFLFEDHMEVKELLEKLSGTVISRLDNFVDICGTKQQRVRAREYIKFALATLQGETVHVPDVGRRDDSTEVEVPTELVDETFGKGRRRHLRHLQGKFECLMLFLKESEKEKESPAKAEAVQAENASSSEQPKDDGSPPPTPTTTTLVILSPWARSRRECMYEILDEIETKKPGWITSSIEPRRANDVQGYCCDRLWLSSKMPADDMPTLKDFPLSSASGGVCSVVGPMLFIEGTLAQRSRGEQYAKWVLEAERRLVQFNSLEKEDKEESQDGRESKRAKKVLEPWQEADLKLDKAKDAMRGLLVISAPTIEGREDCSVVDLLGDDQSVEHKQRLLDMALPKAGSSMSSRQRDLMRIGSRTGTICLLATDRPVEDKSDKLPEVRVLILADNEESRDAASTAVKGAFRDLIWGETKDEWYKDSKFGSDRKRWRDSGGWGKWQGSEDRWNKTGDGSWGRRDNWNKESWKWSDSGHVWKRDDERDQGSWKPRRAGWEHWKPNSGKGWGKGGNDWEKGRWQGNWKKGGGGDSWGRRDEPVKRSWTRSPPRHTSGDTWFKTEGSHMGRGARHSGSRSSARSASPHTSYRDDYRYSPFRDYTPPSHLRNSSGGGKGHSHRLDRTSMRSPREQARPAYEERKRERSPPPMERNRYRESPPPRRATPTERFRQAEDSYYYHSSQPSSAPRRDEYFQGSESPKRRRLEVPRPAWEGRRDGHEPPSRRDRDGYQYGPPPSRNDRGSAPGWESPYEQRRTIPGPRRGPPPPLPPAPTSGGHRYNSGGYPDAGRRR